MLNGEKNVTRVQKEDKDFIRSLMAAGEAIAAAGVGKVQG